MAEGKGGGGKGMRLVKIFLPPDLDDWARIRAAALRLSKSEYIRSLVEKAREECPDPLAGSRQQDKDGGRVV